MKILCGAKVTKQPLLIGIEMMMIIQKKINGDKKDHTKNLLQRYFLFISV
jgi:hypothetical protein